MSQTDFSKFAYSISELANKGPIRRSSIYNQIAAGKLRARKIGRRTVILDEDWRAFLESTPVIAPAKRADEPSDTIAPPRGRGRPPKVAINDVTELINARTKSTATTAKVQASQTPDKTGAGS
jgi:hypothetical protein